MASLPTSFLCALEKSCYYPNFYTPPYSPKGCGNEPEPNFPSPAPWGSLFSFYNGLWPDNIWGTLSNTVLIVEGIHMHVCIYMYFCVHTFFSVHSNAAFSRSLLVPFVLTCFTPHLCLLYTWQTKPSIYQIFWQNAFFLSARQLSVPFTSRWEQAHPSLYTPRWKRCLRSLADLLPGMQFLLRTAPKTVTWASQVESTRSRTTLCFCGFLKGKCLCIWVQVLYGKLELCEAKC